MFTKKILNKLGWLLKTIRYRNKKDPFLEFQRLRENETIPNSNKGNVLLLPIRMAPVSNLFEGVYGYAMKLKGYKVHSLYCQQAINRCENMDFEKYNIVNCSLCKYEQERFNDTFGFVYHSYENYLTKDELKIIKNISYSTDIETLFSLIFDDSNLGQYIESSVMRHLRLSEINLNKYENIIREFTFSTISSYVVTKNLLKKISPKFVVSSHGMYSTWGGALAACNKLNIRIIIWGRGYVGGNIIANHDISYLFDRMYEPNERWLNLKLSNKMEDKVTNYYIQKKLPSSKVDYDNYYKHHKQLNVNRKITNILKLKPDRIRFSLFPNIPYDGTLHSTSKSFPSIRLFLEVTLDWFEKNQECDLIIRTHPAESRPSYQTEDSIVNMIKSIKPELPKNIFVIEPNSVITSYDVAEITDCSLLYAGTMALELSYFGKTVIQCGLSNSSNKGFIFEPKSIIEYQKMLLNASKKELFMTEEMKKNVRKYAYYWLYKRHFPENTYDHKVLTFTKYNFKSSMDLAPGKNKVIDWFINRCEDGKPFIWEETK